MTELHTTSIATASGVARLEEPYMSDSAYVRPMPRLGRGIVWSDIVAEIERDNRARLLRTER